MHALNIKYINNNVSTRNSSYNFTLKDPKLARNALLLAAPSYTCPNFKLNIDHKLAKTHIGIKI